jgi:putative transposase
MDKITQVTYSTIIKDSRLLDLAKESAQIYNFALNTFKNNLDNHVWLSKFSLQKEMSGKFERVFLHSDSYIAALQQYQLAMDCARKAKKEYNKHPEKFSGEPEYPTKEKSINCIVFKHSAIRVKNRKLLLSLKTGNKPIRINWNKELGTPIYAIINWNKNAGWQAHCVLEKTVKEVTDFKKNKILAIDLGVKRIATIFDGENCITFSGKEIKSLIRLREKIKSQKKSDMDKLKKHSRKWKKINQKKRKSIFRVSNKINDVLHKTSRTIVNYAISEKIGEIVIGDNSSTHDAPNTGRITNQVITQNPEQKLRKFIKYKFESTGGIERQIPEPYTSVTCPSCGKHNSTKTRNYKCSCNFRYDRDGVGSVNIWGVGNKVSLGCVLNVVGALTAPSGWKYHSNQKCLVSWRNPATMIRVQ